MVRLLSRKLMNGLLGLAALALVVAAPGGEAQAATAQPQKKGAAQKAAGQRAAVRQAAPAKGHAKASKAGRAGTGGNGLKARSTARGSKAVAGNGLTVPRRKLASVQPAQPSFGQLYGLHGKSDPLDLKSSVALVVDQDTNEVLFSKNAGAVLPIASITKLMTALVVTEAGLSLDEPLEVLQDDVQSTAGSSSRLRLGTQLTRGEMLHLSLMASENRAAHVLGRTFPGGVTAFVASMNRKAHELGMNDTRYVEPTGLSSDNQSSARDLARLVRAAFVHPIIRQLSTSLEAVVPVGRQQVQFRNTNGLVRNPEWEIGLQKTGYISAAGRCLVMQAELAGRKLIMVLLDSAGKYSRIGDAERIRKWVADNPVAAAVGAAPAAAVQAR
jgi:D-alanyl-D-alanine endopeptidase (penicillin-binding protein 7)